MKKLLFISLLSSSIFSTGLEAKSTSFEVKPVLGYRQDGFKWTTKTGATANWKRLKFINYGLETATTFNKIRITLDGTIGNLLKGSLNSSSYFLTPTGTGSFKTRGMAYRVNLGGGYDFCVLKRITLTPLVGYSYDVLQLKLPNKTTSAITSLKNTTQWHGPWAGGELRAKLSPRISLKGSLAYYVSFYDGDGNWKLLGQATNNKFKQSGTSSGLLGKLGVDMKVSKSSAFGVNGNMNWRRLKGGKDKRTLANGRVLSSKFKKINWTSFGANATFTQTF